MAWPKDTLEKHLERRCAEMIREGLLEETAAAIKAGIPLDAPGLQALGYAEALERLQGKISRDEFETRFRLKTRQYVKRQNTWFRADKRIHWVHLNGPPDPDAVADSIVETLQ